VADTRQPYGWREETKRYKHYLRTASSRNGVAGDIQRIFIVNYNANLLILAHLILHVAVETESDTEGAE